jgi:hypothetical protein
MAAAGVVGSLVAQIEDELDALVGAIGEEIPDFRRLPSEALGGAVRGNVQRALHALRDPRAVVELHWALQRRRLQR